MRAIAAGLVACWTAAAALILLGYRPGGPADLLVGAAACPPILIALAAFVWPPVAAGDRIFAGLIWLGVGSLLVLTPALGLILGQLIAGGPQTLLPSLEAAYPWFLGLLGTSLLAGFGIARRLLGGRADRSRRFARGSLIAVAMTATVGTLFAGAAIANELGIREATGPDLEPRACDRPVAAAATARVGLTLDADVDGESLGSLEIGGARRGQDFRWQGFVASRVALGLLGEARIGDLSWAYTANHGWERADEGSVTATGLDVLVLGLVLDPDRLAAAESHGSTVFDGAVATRCRLAIDGATFRAAFPQSRWLIGDVDLERWKGELDFWVFADGEVGRVAGSVNGQAGAFEPSGVQGTLRATLTARDRGADHRVIPPAP